METKILFGVGLVFDTSEYGTIVMGANEELDDLLPSTVQEMIGDQILIKTMDGEERVYNVVSSQINHSIAGKKNVGICLGKEVSPDEVVTGSVVYYYSSEQIDK
ncbi:hypothetical protein HUB98_24435 [Paenibacillus barcinonensis]|uniref:Uncharacterized protein n=1 Tax=Paenibacillus barcinonensis TaxID=198119 RepID=A0A2V4WK81_PAEBA|nr:hypothetical protein [Paenibacillus barcinonensis]PYE47866.1 hypothetical protein DFQ00_111165 [Paenibacillus barcinonensis]QKS59045.1 hypothetical protein HUB98_24435 [Paenibacillus barcinonensis]